jgi:hypothetical protein
VNPARRRTVIWIVVVGGVILLAGGVVAGVIGMAGFVKGMASEPWAKLQEAIAATRTDEGAEAFHRAHPGLAARYPQAAQFMAAARSWRPKVDKLPREVPGLWEVAKAKGEMNVSTSNDETTFTLAHFHGVTARVVTRAGALTDVTIE